VPHALFDFVDQRFDVEGLAEHAGELPRIAVGERPARHDNDREMSGCGSRRQLAVNISPVKERKAKVQDHGVRHFALQVSQGGNSVIDSHDLVPGRLQCGSIQGPEFRIIFDHQDGDRLANDTGH